MSNVPDKKERMDECPHCENFTLMEILWDDTHETYDDLHFEYDEGTISLSLMKCRVCLEITLKETLKYEDRFEMLHFEEKTYYPTPKVISKNIPGAIVKEYETSLRVKRIDPNMCAVAVGRTLEAICNYEKATGKNLAQKLDYLDKKGRIPSTLVKMATELRELRNLGAHNENDEVTEEDIPFILEFLEAILEYLYVAPAKIEALQKRRKRNAKQF